MASKMVGVDRIPSLINHVLEPLRSEIIIRGEGKERIATKKILEGFEEILGMKKGDSYIPSWRIALVNMRTTAALRALGDIAESRQKTQPGSWADSAASLEGASNVEIEKAVAQRRQALEQLAGLAEVLVSLGKLDRSVVSQLPGLLDGAFKWEKSYQHHDMLRVKIWDHGLKECLVTGWWADKANPWEVVSLSNFDESFANCSQGTVEDFERVLNTLMGATSGIPMKYEGLQTAKANLLKAVQIAQSGVIVVNKQGECEIARAAFTYPSGYIDGFYIDRFTITNQMKEKQVKAFVLLKVQAATTEQAS